MRFESWYLKRHISKRKWATLGLLLVVVAVSTLSAGPTSVYFSVEAQVAKDVDLYSNLVMVTLPQAVNQSEVSGVSQIGGVRDVIPAVLDGERTTANGVIATPSIYFVSSSDAPSLFSTFQLNPAPITSQRGWFYFGAGVAQASGISESGTTPVEVSGLGNMTAASAKAVQSNSDWYVFGDIQTYWASTGQTVKPGEYNYLFVVTTNSTAADGLVTTLASTHPGWKTFTSSDLNPSPAAVDAAQLNLMLVFTSISWAFGFLVFVIYIEREVSSRSKELVTFAALGASRGALTKSMSYYLLLITSIGSISGLALCLGVLLPWSMGQIYGFTYYQAASTIIDTALVVMLPVLAFDAIIVAILRWRLGKLDMMNFLRSEV
jgi:ABC-type antimicrobial peptide transport system permease subunit